MSKEKVTLKIECKPCMGTGIYRGFAEPRGVGVVCLECDGTGCNEKTFTLFEQRKKRDDINTVKLSRGTLIMNCGPAGKEISYDEFLKGKMPTV